MKAGVVAEGSRQVIQIKQNQYNLSPSMNDPNMGVGTEFLVSHPFMQGADQPKSGFGQPLQPAGPSGLAGNSQNAGPSDTFVRPKISRLNSAVGQGPPKPPGPNSKGSLVSNKRLMIGRP